MNKVQICLMSIKTYSSFSSCEVEVENRSSCEGGLLKNNVSFPRSAYWYHASEFSDSLLTAGVRQRIDIGPVLAAQAQFHRTTVRSGKTTGLQTTGLGLAFPTNPRYYQKLHTFVIMQLCRRGSVIHRRNMFKGTSITNLYNYTLRISRSSITGITLTSLSDNKLALLRSLLMWHVYLKEDVYRGILVMDFIWYM